VQREAAAYRAMRRADPGFAFHLRAHAVCRTEARPSCDTDYLRAHPKDPRGILVMDRAGASLRRVLVEGLDDSGIDYAENVNHLVRAVEAMAREGLVHGDLHADNLVFGTDGLLRIIDFGAMEYTTPEQARAALPDSIRALQETFRRVLDHKPELRETRPETFARLEAFVGPAEDD